MDKEIIILEQIQNNPQVSQRDLASIAQASLGMTNAILKRFVKKGFITIKKVNNRNIHYILTTDGLDEISKRSWSYFRRTIKNVVVYQDAIFEIVKQVKKEEYCIIALQGQSDFEFIIEHVCYKMGIEFKLIPQEIDDFSEGVFCFISESSNKVDNDKNMFSLKHLIIG
ncbi:MULTISPECIES: winged helix-turn-helix transcriptional regulator [unclassified Oceanispirochaeta]|uniref:winged helix-turn-helix transcriptional regulator n=1 Tax=unclassified Oceanispirochaeta TaxID=2635722 RepID=UPI000E090E7C|nr:MULTISPECIES: winged helix-turn-helix transcriptional regulator [unclassified Oceanispirochaeta]MBF9018683.1 winged helix-turn-helix transcriptional regulator [Oceanispirochaeta sp. M2]NPD75121.1 winged helix-turn-helix transcriptional regulator [Oceanispirochaeta sp. M1]RDG29045.1 winged helix-turn-helix transcriptional regulator [Oceanispirochaeta sp. M1]